jgi:hypothetical protein
LFAFLVWYLTGQSIRALFVLAPASVFNAFGWFLLILALGAPLWSAYLALRLRSDRDRFGPPTDEERFISGYLARRTFATALSPVFQLIFIAELAGLALARVARREVGSKEMVQRISAELRAEWAQSLIVILVFLFAYLFFLSSEVRFARKIDRYDALLARPRWEAVWPVFLIALILSTIGTTQVLDWVLGNQGNLGAFLKQQMLAQPVDLVEAGKTVVFQGTFLSVLVLVMLLLAFPPAEVLAALRLPYQPADEATIQHRAQYWVRSIAILRVARVNWLYGGTMIGGLSAMTILSRPVAVPLVHQVLYILGPSLIGFIGYAFTRRYLQNILKSAPAVERLVQRQVEDFRQDLARIRRERARRRLAPSIGGAGSPHCVHRPLLRVDRQRDPATRASAAGLARDHQGLAPDLAVRALAVRRAIPRSLAGALDQSSRRARRSSVLSLSASRRASAPRRDSVHRIRTRARTVDRSARRA